MEKKIVKKTKNNTIVKKEIKNEVVKKDIVKEKSGTFVGNNPKVTPNTTMVDDIKKK